MEHSFISRLLKTAGVKAALDRLAIVLRGQSPDRLDAFWTDVMAKPETLSDTIAAIIKARGITSYALAKASGVNASVIQRFVNGERGRGLRPLKLACAGPSTWCSPRRRPSGLRRSDRPQVRTTARPITKKAALSDL